MKLPLFRKRKEAIGIDVSHIQYKKNEHNNDIDMTFRVDVHFGGLDWDRRFTGQIYLQESDVRKMMGELGIIEAMPTPPGDVEEIDLSNPTRKHRTICKNGHFKPYRGRCETCDLKWMNKQKAKRAKV